MQPYKFHEKIELTLLLAQEQVIASADARQLFTQKHIDTLVPPTRLFIMTKPAWSDTTVPMTAASLPNGLEWSDFSVASTSFAVSMASNLPSLAT